MNPFVFLLAAIAIFTLLVLVVRAARPRPYEQIGLDAARHRAAMAGHRLGVANDRRDAVALTFADRLSPPARDAYMKGRFDNYPPRPVSALDNRHDDGLVNGVVIGSMLHSPHEHKRQSETPAPAERYGDAGSREHDGFITGGGFGGSDIVNPSYDSSSSSSSDSGGSSDGGGCGGGD